MPIIEFKPSGKTIDVAPGTQLLDAARLAGVEIVSPCGGKGTCGKCIVKIVDGEVDSDSLGMLPQDSVAEGHVLACKTKVLKTPITVEVPEQIGQEGGKFIEIDETHLVREELLPKEWEYDPLAVKWLIRVPEPQPEDGLSDLDRLTRSIQKQWGKENVVCSLRVLRTLADTLRAQGGEVTVTLIREPEQLHVIRLEPGDTTTRLFGIAVDVGTTTVAVQLLHLTDRQILGTRSDYNAQIPCGLDVISRINYASRPDRLQELRVRILGTINTLIRQVAQSHGVDPREIYNAVISGNTTMTHLLLGLNPEYIRLEPYTPTVLEVPYLMADEIGIEINPDSWVYLSPGVGSYVGGDITAGILCTDLATETKDINLFIDIGTNGEMVLGNSEFLMTCACSAGPAFEGQGIDCGMRAALGAIEKVTIDPATGQAGCSTVGNVKPKGICGSGIIDLIANLFLTGWIDAAGKFDRVRPNPLITVDGRIARYTIVTTAESGTGKPIVISEIDIENIIRTKAAIYTACALMLQQVEMSFQDLNHIYIAGGFGRFLDLEKAILIGLIPDIPREKFSYIGNSSLMGSYMVAVSQDYRQRQLNLAKRMTYLELNTNPSYMDQYTAALFLPHTDMNKFPSVSEAKAKVSVKK
jgi:uncharacterized 2Fe-2S/4Fe-4S cluster protein (DUF4445 family)